jgi:hypothetical protein
MVCSTYRISLCTWQAQVGEGAENRTVAACPQATYIVIGTAEFPSFAPLPTRCPALIVAVLPRATELHHVESNAHGRRDDTNQPRHRNDQAQMSAGDGEPVDQRQQHRHQDELGWDALHQAPMTSRKTIRSARKSALLVVTSSTMSASSWFCWMLGTAIRSRRSLSKRCLRKHDCVSASTMPATSFWGIFEKPDPHLRPHASQTEGVPQKESRRPDARDTYLLTRNPRCPRRLKPC